MFDNFIQNLDCLPPHIRVGEPAEVPDFIQNPDVNLIIWPLIPFGLRQRPDGDALALASEECCDRKYFHPLTISPANTNVETIADAFSRYRSSAKFLAYYAMQLVENYHVAFPNIAHAHINLRLERSLLLDHNNPIVHCDGTKNSNWWRLIATPFGPPTQWASSDYVQRCNSKGEPIETPSTLGIVRDNRFIRQFGNGYAALFRSGQNGLFHRRPLMEKRMLRTTLSITPNFP